MTPKVSIIIPFNNVEDYIGQCLDSVLSQTLSDMEVILINDASTDKSRAIAKSRAQKDERIKIMDTEKRSGQGYARNRGLEAARGDYIGFVDSDDFVQTNMFELLYNNAQAHNTDITMCMVREYDDLNGIYLEENDYYSLSCLNSFNDEIFSAEDTKDNILDINAALWNKIYRREYLNKIGEKFPEGYIYEDLPFFFGTYLPAKRISIVWKNLYIYRVNRKNSTMRQFNNKILDRPPMVSLSLEKLKAAPYMNNSKQKIQGWIINDLFHRYTLLKENYHREFFFLMKKVFTGLEIENIEDSYWSKVYHFQGYLLVMNNTFEDFNQKVFNEYLDIHKVENRLRSEMTDSKDIERRFNLVYADFNKNYKYTEELFNQAKELMEQTLNEKYNYLYNDIKDLSFEIQTRCEDFEKNNNHLSKDIICLQEQLNASRRKIEDDTAALNNDLKSYFNTKLRELENNIEQASLKFLDYTEQLKLEAENERQNHITAMKKMKSDFDFVIDNMKQKHTEEKELLQSQMLKIQADLREEMKSPLKKFIEKHKNKRNKNLL